MDPLKRWQAEAILARHGDRVGGFEIAVTFAVVCLAVSPLLVGFALCAGWLPR